MVPGEYVGAEGFSLGRLCPGIESGRGMKEKLPRGVCKS